MKMKKVFLVRHGGYEQDTGRLTARGKQQMRDISRQIRPLIGGQSYALWVSDSPRCMESGDIMAPELGDASPEVCHQFWSHGESTYRPEAALALIRERGEAFDALVVVTHLEYVESFPGYLGIHLLDFYGFPRSRIWNGQAWHINLANRTCDLLR